MPRKNNSELTRQKIIEVATEIFMSKGFEETTMKDIVSGVGMSSGAIFHHYASKKEILDAVIKAQEAWLTEIYEGWLEEFSTLNARDKLRAILGRQLELFEENQTEEMFAQLNQSPQMIVSQMISNVNHNAHYLTRLFEEGNADGSMSVSNAGQCAKVFMLLYNTWTDPTVFEIDVYEMEQRMRYLQELMRQMGADVITDENIEKNVTMFRKILGKS